MNLLKKLCLTTVMMAAVLFYGCDISDSNKSTVNEELTDEELKVAGQIIAESLSDQKDGIFASLNDAFSLPSNSNLASSSVEKGKFASPVFGAAMAKNNENNANNYSYSYNPDKGIHLVNFSRSIHEEDFTKESTAELEYIYYDASGNFIYSPRLDSDLIETIEYNGFRSGSISTPDKNSSYERTDEFRINGLNSGGPLTIEGLHEGSGQFEVTRENGDVIKRNYTLTVEFLDVQINSQTLSDGSLQKSVEGALAYEMMISKNLNGDESMKTVNGTIQFNGDGTALLRFQNILDDFKVTLEKGNLISDNEFEGFVESADTGSDPKSFTLSGGQTYLFGTDTKIDTEGDIATLSEVQAIKESGIRVRAEGTFAENTDGAFIIQNVKFEFEDDDLEFEDTVESADTDEGTFTLEDGNTYHITDETSFDEEGDLFSLEDLLWAIDNDYTVKAEGEFVPGEEEAKNVTEVKLEYDEADFEFDDDVLSANSEAGTFDLEDGNTYTILEGTTMFDEDSDYSSLEEVVTALSEGAEVEAEGDYAPQSDGSLLVTNVIFEADDDDDENGGDDDENSAEHESEGSVESADAADKTFTLTNDLTFYVNNSTEFDEDIQSLGNLVGALQRGDYVYGKVEYYIDSDDRKVAVEAEFDVERRNGDDDDDDDQEENEFESDVTSADLTARSFTLANGLTLFVNNDTEFDDDDIESLEELADALGNGEEVEAEGEYYTNSKGNIVIEVEFDVERREDDDDDSDDDGDEENEFGGKINTVDPDGNSFELMNGQTYVLSTDIQFDDDGDLFSLQEVADDVADGFVVTTEGTYDPQDDGTRLVVSVKFESNRDDDDDEGDDDSDDNGDDDDGDDDDGTEEKEFEGSVSGVTTSTFVVNNITLTVNDDTVIEIEGDDDNIQNLKDIADAIKDGAEVEADGEYYQDGSDNFVIEVEFDIERNEDGDDDSDDGDDSDEDEDGDNDSDDNGDDDSEGDDDDSDNGDDSDDGTEEKEFEGSVSGVTTSTFVVNNITLTVNDDTVIEIEGDDDNIQTLKDIADAIEDGAEVEADGEYYEDGSDYFVIEVEFDIEDNEDGGDDSDDGDDNDSNDDDDEDDDDNEDDD